MEFRYASFIACGAGETAFGVHININQNIVQNNLRGHNCNGNENSGQYNIQLRYLMIANIEVQLVHKGESDRSSWSFASTLWHCSNYGPFCSYSGHDKYVLDTFKMTLNSLKIRHWNLVARFWLIRVCEITSSEDFVLDWLKRSNLSISLAQHLHFLLFQDIL